jgi:O-antigen/teichoic acid export membrane protein
VLLICTFLLNAGLNFGLGLFLAAFLGPEEFARYAISFSLANLLHVLALDWLRLAVLRFYSETTHKEEPDIGASLTVLQILFSGLMLPVGGLMLIFFQPLAIEGSFLLILLMAALASGWLEYLSARARARFQERLYAGLVAFRNLAAFLIMGGTAFWLRDASMVLLAFVASTILALSFLGYRLRKEAPFSILKKDLPERELVLRFARYAAPLVAANLLYQLLPLISRLMSAHNFGLTQAGYFSLSFDIGWRIFATLGSAIDILLFQIAVRRAEQDGLEAGRMQIRQNAALVSALILPLATGFFLLREAFCELIIPSAYREAFLAHISLLIPALALFALLQFALNPAFQLDRRTRPSLLAACVALGAGGVSLWLFAHPAFILAPSLAPSLAVLCGYGAAFVIACLVAIRSCDFFWPLKDMAIIACACVLMAVVLLAARHEFSAIHQMMIAAPLASGLGFVVLLAGNVGGIRTKMTI